MCGVAAKRMCAGTARNVVVMGVKLGVPVVNIADLKVCVLFVV